MVEKDYFRMLSDEEASRYKFGFCKNCPFYECELIEEYMQFKKSHTRIQEPEPLVSVMSLEEYYAEGGGALIETEVVSVDDYDDECGNDIFSPQLQVRPADTDSSDEDILSYDQSKRTDHCIMNQSVYQVECDRKTVTEGIGDHYKIETNYNHKIEKGITDRWEPSQPVFISAQTGQGKNYFIENTLIPYVRELNHKHRTKQKVLILSNRLALKAQIKNRLNGTDDPDVEKEKYSYNEYADVRTYQSLLLYKNDLEVKQKYAKSRYIFVICDEAHFFTSDAMFNPHTQKILQAIIQVFKSAVRIYMSATPYECLKYIIDYEQKMMIFYHFKRDYSYLDVKTYSSINELYGEIVESVNKRKEKWLIFIDDKKKGVIVKKQLEKFAEDMKCPLVVENDKKKDDGEDKENNSRKTVEKVYAVNANSKQEPIYQEIVKNERLNNDTYVLISTSVLDNGVNLTGIKNIVVSDMEKAKCLQMVGRARVKGDDDRKNLYIKRFDDDEVDKRKIDLMKQRDAYDSYKIAYNDCEKAMDCFDTYTFFEKYYNGSEEDWMNAKHWFGRPKDEPTRLYLNEIAESLVERLIPQYEYILDEMIDEGSKEDDQQNGKNKIGQKYLEYQLSWFGKRYCEDDDITFADKEKAKKEFIAFLESYAKSGEQIIDTGKESIFREKFTRLYDAAFGRRDRNKKRVYSITVMNASLEEESINYKIVSYSSYWVVEEYDWELEDSE